MGAKYTAEEWEMKIAENQKKVDHCRKMIAEYNLSFAVRDVSKKLGYKTGDTSQYLSGKALMSSRFWERFNLAYPGNNEPGQTFEQGIKVASEKKETRPDKSNDTDSIQLIKYLKYQMSLKGISQVDLSRKLNKDDSYIGKMVMHGNPSYLQLASFQESTKIPIFTFLGPKKPKVPPFTEYDKKEMVFVLALIKTAIHEVQNMDLSAPLKAHIIQQFNSILVDLEEAVKREKQKGDKTNADTPNN